MNSRQLDDNELTDKQVRTRWGDVKKEIRNRPLLAYRVGIPLSEWDKYIHSVPPKEEVNRIYHEIKEDRRLKTERIRERLSKIVGYREINLYAEKMGVSNTTVRHIIERKTERAGYDVINRIELFINAVDKSFEVSLENPKTLEGYIQELIERELENISRISNYLNRLLYELPRTIKQPKIDFYGKEEHPASDIQYCIDRLQKSKEQIDMIYDVFIKKQ